MARVRRIALIEREIRERLGEAAVDLLLASASILVEGLVKGLAEGQRGTAARAGRQTYFGTVMLTIDLNLLGPQLRGAEDPVAAARRAADLMARDLRIDRRLRKLAIAEAERKVGSRLREPECELRVRADRGVIYIDLDVEAALS
jgi:hypothetical protein